MKLTWLAVVSAGALLVSCGPSGEDASANAPHVEDHAEHEGHSASETPVLLPDETGYAVAGAMIRPPPGGRDVTGAYFDVVSAKDDAIVAASTDAVSSIELHTHVDEDGVMVMKKLDQVPLKAGEVVSFKPKGLHLMMFGADGLEEGAHVEVTLEFASGAAREVDFVVKNPLIDMMHEH